MDGHAAARLHAELMAEFGADRLFMDVDDNAILGVDFVEHIRDQVLRCDAFLAVIGPGWLADRNRLATDRDFVRIEIETALSRPECRVIPVMIDDAGMPDPATLPANLRPLATRGGVTLRHDGFSGDVRGRLLGVLRSAIATQVLSPSGADADTAGQPRPEETGQEPERLWSAGAGGKRGIWMAAGLGVIVALALVAFVAYEWESERPPAPDPGPDDSRSENICLDFSIADGRLFGCGKPVNFQQSTLDIGLYADGQPEFIIVSTTITPSLSATLSYAAGPNARGNYHIVVDRDGSVGQSVALDRVAAHAGASSYEGRTGLNRLSWGIGMVNWGQLRERGGKLLTVYDSEVADSEVFKYTTPDGETVFLHQFTREQLLVLEAVVRALVRENPNVTQVLQKSQVNPRKVSAEPILGLETIEWRAFRKRQTE